METLKLTETELAEMKLFYQEEYDRALKRIQHIQKMLIRLGEEIHADNSNLPDIQQSIANSGLKKTQVTAKRKKKVGRKSKWDLLIMKRLRQLDRPVTYDELTEEIMAFSKLPENKKTSTKQAVVNVIFRLRNRDKKLDTFSMGTREKYIALKNWFEKPGEIKKEYAAKVSLPESKKPTKRARRGRPPKKG